jgi:hypothetical protein
MPRHVVAFLAGTCAVACVLSAVDLNGRPCDSRNSCVPPHLCDHSKSNQPGRCWGNDGSIHIDEFKAPWTTPNGIYFSWKLSSKDPNTSVDSIERAIHIHLVNDRGETSDVDATVNGELNLRYLTLNGARDSVTGTFVASLARQTTYTATLFVEAIADKSVSSAGPISATTRIDLPPCTDILSDNLMGVSYNNVNCGMESAGPLKPGAGKPYMGFYATQTIPPTTTCEWWNIHLNKSVSTSALKFSSEFGHGPYLEVALRLKQTFGALPYAEFHLLFNNVSNRCANGQPYCDYSAQLAAQRTDAIADAFRLYQFPLNAFKPGAGTPPLDQTALDAGLYGVVIGSAFSPGAIIDIDQLRICNGN